MYFMMVNFDTLVTFIHDVTPSNPDIPAISAAGTSACRPTRRSSGSTSWKKRTASFSGRTKFRKRRSVFLPRTERSEGAAAVRIRGGARRQAAGHDARADRGGKDDRECVGGGDVRGGEKTVSNHHFVRQIIFVKFLRKSAKILRSY